MDDRTDRAGAARRRYRVLLGLLPRGFRRRWGGDLEEVFLLRLEEAGPGRLARGWVWARAVWDVVGTAARERARRWISSEEGGMGTTMQDLGQSARALLRTPLLALTAVGTLALGIAATTTTFSVVHAVLLAPLPYEAPEELVVLWPERNFNAAMVREAEARIPAVEAVAGASLWGMTLTGEGEPYQLMSALVTPGYFRLLGVEPARGRDFRPEDALPGRGDVAILTHDLWVRAFGADPGVVGRSIELAGADQARRTVVGVLPEDFVPPRGAGSSYVVDVFAPLVADPALGIADDPTWYVPNNVARLAPGATLAQAEEQLRAFARQAREEAPRILQEDVVQRASVQPLRRQMAGYTRTPLLVALGAVLLVLLIACANVANLLVARGEARSRDLSVRVALGAGRARVARLLLAEHVLLAVVGGATGVGLAWVLTGLVTAAAPPDFPRLDQVAVNGPVLAVALAATVVAALVAGVVPAVRASRVDALAGLGMGGKGTGGRQRSLLALSLVAAQVALAAVVAVGSGLMLRSLDRMLSIETGVRAEGVLTFRVNPPENRYPDNEVFAGFYADLLERIRAVPGVASAGAINILPGTTNNWSFPVYPEGVVHEEGNAVPTENFRAIWPGYFETAGIPVLQGRPLTEADDAAGEVVTVVNRAFAEKWWPGEEAVGKTLRLFSATGSPYRVVGVVGDVRQFGPRAPVQPEMYFAQEQMSQSVGQAFLVRAEGSLDPLSLADEMRAAVWELDPDVPVHGVRTFASVLGESTATSAFLALLLALFGALAVTLGAVGVFGVTAFTVGRRIPEFGVRMALGSSRWAVVASAVRGSVIPVAAGLGVGLLAAYGASGLLESALYEIPATDPWTYAGVGLLLAAAGMAASLVPSWRASRVDPVEVLNSE